MKKTTFESTDKPVIKNKKNVRGVSLGVIGIALIVASATFGAVSATCTPTPLDFALVGGVANSVAGSNESAWTPQQPTACLDAQILCQTRFVDAQSTGLDAQIALANCNTNQTLDFEASNRLEAPKKSRRVPPPSAPKVDDETVNKYVAFYEQNIAKEKVVSKYDDNQIDALATQHGIDKNQTKLCLIAVDLSKRNGNPTSLDALAKMNERKRFGYGIGEVKKYIDSLTDEEKENLKEKFEELNR